MERFLGTITTGCMRPFVSRTNKSENDKWPVAPCVEYHTWCSAVGRGRVGLGTGHGSVLLCVSRAASLLASVAGKYVFVLVRCDVLKALIIGENTLLLLIQSAGLPRKRSWFPSVQAMRFSRSLICHGRMLMELSRVGGREGYCLKVEGK